MTTYCHHKEIECPSFSANEGTSLIELADICFWRGTKEILHDINLTINRNDFIAITGPNGGGKTTLLRVILKLIKPQKGKIIYSFDNSGTDGLTIGYLPQKNMIDSRFPLTVYDVVSAGLINDKKLSKTDKQEKIADMIHLMGLEAKSRHAIGELSGGQLQRVLLGRALVASPDILILDEPLSYIDKHFENKIYNILGDLKSTATILLVSHEISEIASMANRHIIVDHTLRFCKSGTHFVHYNCHS